VKVLLVDNGSLEPAAALALRGVAARLSERGGCAIYPVSLAHSDKISSSQLGGVPAHCIAAVLREQLEQGEHDFVLLPFFIGPSRAVTHALPKLVETLRSEFPDLRVRIAPALHASGDNTLARILAERVRDALAERGQAEDDTGMGKRVRVALVDHGSPVREVTAMRDEVTAQLAALLSEEGQITEVAACSMERRPGADYAFNEPLLETLLAHKEWRGSAAAQSLIIVAQLFLLPGRHAGPEGDIAQLCARAAAHAPNLLPVQTEPLATHPLIVELLAQRLAATSAELAS